MATTTGNKSASSPPSMPYFSQGGLRVSAKQLKEWGFYGAASALFAIGCAMPPATKPSIDSIQHIIVIYAENRSFDHLYGLFPGANGIANATPEQYIQVDR